MDRYNAYFTTVIDLRDTEADVDVVQDYDDVRELVDAGIAWRKYRIPLEDFVEFEEEWSPYPIRATHFRIWYEDPSGDGSGVVEIQISDLKFVE